MKKIIKGNNLIAEHLGYVNLKPTIMRLEGIADEDDLIDVWQIGIWEDKYAMPHNLMFGRVQRSELDPNYAVLRSLRFHDRFNELEPALKKILENRRLCFKTFSDEFEMFHAVIEDTETGLLVEGQHADFKLAVWECIVNFLLQQKRK